MTNKVTYSKADPYHKLVASRLKQALKCPPFYRELVISYFVGTMGLWLLHLFPITWNGDFFGSRDLFIYGIAANATVLGVRFFMEKNEDNRGDDVTKIIIFVLLLLSTILFFMGAIWHQGNYSVYSSSAFLITFITWLLHQVCHSKFDKPSSVNILGGAQK